jgi:hypothetical protein
VRVRQEEKIDGLGIESGTLPIQRPELLEPLKQTGIDQKPTRIGLDQMSRPGDGAGATMKRQSQCHRINSR